MFKKLLGLTAVILLTGCITDGIQLNAHLSQGIDHLDGIARCREEENFKTVYAPVVYAHKKAVIKYHDAVSAGTVTDEIRRDEQAKFDALVKADTDCQTQLGGK